MGPYYIAEPVPLGGNLLRAMAEEMQSMPSFEATWGALFDEVKLIAAKLLEHRPEARIQQASRYLL